MKLPDYAELEQPRPDSKETDVYWKKKPVKKRKKNVKKSSPKRDAAIRI